MISVTLIVKNSSVTLSKCLESVKSLTDDIVVVIDKSSTDNSVQIAQKYGAKVFYRSFDNFAAQKNFAVGKTKYDWVFSLDADVQSSDTLNTEIINAIKSTNFVAYNIPRLNIIFKKPIYHTNWGLYDDSHVWLFNKKKCKWEGDVHEEVVCKGKIGKLTNYKIHNSYSTVEEFINKMNMYTTKESKQNRMYANPIYDFLRRYFWHLGFLDGWHGLFLSYLMFIYHVVIWVKKSFSLSS